MPVFRRRRKLPIAFLAAATATAPFLSAQEVQGPRAPQPAPVPFGGLTISSNTPPADVNAAREDFTFDVEWRLIPAGVAHLNWKPMPGSEVAASEARLHLESTGIVSRLFRVTDDYTSMMGQNFCGGGTFMAAREGSRNKETRVTYDQQAHHAKYLEKDLVKNTVVKQEVDTPPCVHDVLGGLVLLRSLRLEPGKTVQLPVSDGRKAALVRIEGQRREEIVTPLGTFPTIRYEVFLFDNVIYKRSGHVHIWLTDDAVRLPVQLQVRLQFAIGTITLKLAKEERLPL